MIGDLAGDVLGGQQRDEVLSREDGQQRSPAPSAMHHVLKQRVGVSDDRKASMPRVFGERGDRGLVERLWVLVGGGHQLMMLLCGHDATAGVAGSLVFARPDATERLRSPQTALVSTLDRLGARWLDRHVPFDPPIPQPSPAERWYMEQAMRQRQEAADAEARWWASLSEEERTAVTRQREDARRRREAEQRAAAEQAAEHRRRQDTVDTTVVELSDEAAFDALFVSASPTAQFINSARRQLASISPDRFTDLALRRLPLGRKPEDGNKERTWLYLLPVPVPRAVKREWGRQRFKVWWLGFNVGSAGTKVGLTTDGRWVWESSAEGYNAGRTWFAPVTRENLSTLMGLGLTARTPDRDL